MTVDGNARRDTMLAQCSVQCGHFGEVMSGTREVLGVRQDVSKLTDNSTW